MTKEQAISMFGICPDGSSPQYYFETEMGSRYVRTTTGWSRRIKFDGTGLHEWNNKSLFIPWTGGRDQGILLGNVARIALCELKYSIMFLQNEGHIGLFVRKTVGSDFELVTDSSQLDGSSVHCGTPEFTKIPTVGFSVFEIRQQPGRTVHGFHPGHRVTVVQVL